MIAFTVKPHIDPRLVGVLHDIAPSWRRGLLSVGSNALKIEVKDHLRRIAPLHHRTAERLGGIPTGHITKGRARVTSRSTSDHAEVCVPIAGIRSAFGDIVIRPRQANALTIPIASAAYGHRVRELRRAGWTIFRPKGHDVLMGFNGDDADSTEPLYALRKQVTVRQDRTLLPDDARVTQVINEAMIAYLKQASK